MKAKKKKCDGCEKDRIIWKNHISEDGERMQLCKVCSAKESRSAHKSQNKKSKKTTYQPIRPRSLKRATQEREYSKKNKIFLENNPYCQIAIKGVCTSKSTEVHHVDGRTNEKLTDETGFKASCRSCHKWVHDNPQHARNLGHLI